MHLQELYNGLILILLNYLINHLISLLNKQTNTHKPTDRHTRVYACLSLIKFANMLSIHTYLYSINKSTHTHTNKQKDTQKSSMTASSSPNLPICPQWTHISTKPINTQTHTHTNRHNTHTHTHSQTDTIHTHTHTRAL